MLLGFLFGIPRFLARSGSPVATPNAGGQQPAQPPPAQNAGGQQAAQPPPAQNAGGQQPAQPPAQEAGTQQLAQPPPAQDSALGSVNTNLEEISDWLTKIIVGVSLVELQKAQVKLQQAAGFIAQTLGGSSQTSFAYGLMVYFSICGFLGSYLLTRLYLQRAFREAASGS
jgi:hypothetical protein